MQRIEIEEIKKYVDELAGLLEQAGNKATVASLRSIAQRFKDPAEVRPAVYALDQALRKWLSSANTSQLDANTQLTAQFLVDACKNALSQGAIRSLPPTPKESAKRLGRVAMITAGVGVVLVLLPALLLAVGVDWIALLMPPKVSGTQLDRGTQLAIAVKLASPAPDYKGGVDVRADLAGHCQGPLWDELTCEPAERLWDDGLRHRTFHIVRPAEVSGILVALANPHMRGAYGVADLLVFADQSAAAGEYVIPLEGAYVAAPEPCVVTTRDAAVADASIADAAVDAQVVTPCTAQPAAGETDALPLKRSPIASVVVHVR